MVAIKLTLVALAGWMNREQRHAIDYLQEEIGVLKEQQGSKRSKFADEQRRREYDHRTRVLADRWGRGGTSCRERVGGLLRYCYRDAA